MIKQELGPGVQDGGERDRDAEPTAGDLLQSLGDGGEQEAIGHRGGGEEEIVQLRGNGEDDMKVLDGEQVAALRFEEARWIDAAAGNEPVDLLWSAGRARPLARARRRVRTRGARASGPSAAGCRCRGCRDEERFARLELGGPHAPGVRD